MSTGTLLLQPDLKETKIVENRDKYAMVWFTIFTASLTCPARKSTDSSSMPPLLDSPYDISWHPSWSGLEVANTYVENHGRKIQNCFSSHVSQPEYQKRQTHKGE